MGGGVSRKSPKRSVAEGDFYRPFCSCFRLRFTELPLLPGGGVVTDCFFWFFSLIKLMKVTDPSWEREVAQGAGKKNCMVFALAYRESFESSLCFHGSPQCAWVGSGICVAVAVGPQASDWVAQCRFTFNDIEVKAQVWTFPTPRPWAGLAGGPFCNGDSCGSKTRKGQRGTGRQSTFAHAFPPGSALFFLSCALSVLLFPCLPAPQDVRRVLGKRWFNDTIIDWAQGVAQPIPPCDEGVQPAASFFQPLSWTPGVLKATP